MVKVKVALLALWNWKRKNWDKAGQDFDLKQVHCSTPSQGTEAALCAFPPGLCPAVRAGQGNVFCVHRRKGNSRAAGRGLSGGVPAGLPLPVVIFHCKPRKQWRPSMLLATPPQRLPAGKNQQRSSAQNCGATAICQELQVAVPYGSTRQKSQKRT